MNVQQILLMYVCAVRIHSVLLQLRAIIDASDVAACDQPLLLLLGELIFVSAQYDEDGKLIDYESVVRQTERDIVEHQMAPGVRGKYMRLTTLNVKVRV